MRFNLNRVNYSKYDDETLLHKLDNLRNMAHAAIDDIEAEAYDDKAEDIYCILLNRNVDRELLYKADRSELI